MRSIFSILLNSAYALFPLFLEEQKSYTPNDILSCAGFLMQKLPEGHGEKAVLMTDNTALLYASLTALWLKGWNPVMPNGFREAPVSAALSDVSLLVYDKSAEAQDEPESKIIYDRICRKTIEISAAWLNQNIYPAESVRQELKVLSPDREKLFSITQMTSGSTGTPKKIKRSLDSFYKETASAAEEIPLLKEVSPAESDREFKYADAGYIAVSTVPCFHAYGIMFRFFVPIMYGIPSYVSVLNYEEQFEKIKSYHRRLYAVVNPGFLKRLDGISSGIPTSFILSAGGKLGGSAFQAAMTFFNHASMMEILGSTETGVLAFRHLINGDEHWCALQGSYFRVVSAEQDGTFREEKTGTGFVAAYLQHMDPEVLKNQPLPEQLAAADFKRGNGAFISEDMAELLPNGTFVLLGRSGRIIKIEDNRISLDELEEELRHHPFIRDAAVVPYQNGQREGTAAMIILTSAGRKAQETACSAGRFIIALRSSLREYVLPIAVPRRFIITDSMPATPTGKVAYPAVKELFAHEIS